MISTPPYGRTVELVNNESTFLIAHTSQVEMTIETNLCSNSCFSCLTLSPKSFDHSEREASMASLSGFEPPCVH